MCTAAPLVNTVQLDLVRGLLEDRGARCSQRQLLVKKRLIRAAGRVVPPYRIPAEERLAVGGDAL